ncbi:mannitol dehydrogenase [Arthrobacter sp. TPD3018]|uniref:mannitol dehydrogenase family protein n=1 Tax=Bacteria TaxID=2 RepID=UPI000D50C569|nr:MULTISPECIES: mannitol dehydrogenase family protein [Bacteria]PVE59481.1 mannitol dehydrogenase [Sphingomonas sp. TPD3009]PVE61000.1 mannitol dehydrogenase [Arthrobacter sp. TPD3018]PVE87681.1 mannitol dehydrogenase [Sphingomonas melonis]
MRLSRATLPQVPAAIAAPRERPESKIGIVHFGPGAFHRAHQATYIDDLLARDPNWGIAAVSLRSAGTVEALAAQDGLYTLVVRDAEPAMRIIGAHKRFLGPDDHTDVAALLADPNVRLVTMTVTEKGYCLQADGTLDMAHADIVHDLAGEPRRSIVGWLVAGLAARRTAGVAPFVAMPCDNLASNGRKLHAALVAFAAASDPELAAWIAETVRVPSTMVDSITPASDATLLTDVSTAIGLDDDAPVQREAFVQWVIEDVGADAITALGSVGATLTQDVASYERAKLRILNGAHSTLAYIGLLRGATSVAEAMADGPLAAFVAAMIRQDIAPMLTPVAGFDLDAYAAAILTRFRNPAIVHRLDQIAQDGSQKLPYRLGDTLVANRQAGRMPAHVVRALGAWVAFLMARARTDTAIVDPAAETLLSIAQQRDVAAVIDALIAAGHLVPSAIATDAEVRAAIVSAATAAASADWPRFFA